MIGSQTKNYKDIKITLTGVNRDKVRAVWNLRGKKITTEGKRIEDVVNTAKRSIDTFFLSARERIRKI